MRRILALILTIGLALGLSLSGCARVQQNTADGSEQVTLGMSYIPDVQFAPFYVAESEGLFTAAGVNAQLRHHGIGDDFGLGFAKRTMRLQSGQRNGRFKKPRRPSNGVVDLVPLRIELLDDDQPAGDGTRGCGFAVFRQLGEWHIIERSTVQIGEARHSTGCHPAQQRPQC